MSKMCQSHWDKMRAAIEARGMSHLVARDGEAAMQNMMAELEGTDTPQNWDPLMTANWAITSEVLHQGGLAILTEEDICPLCMVQESYEKCLVSPPPNLPEQVRIADSEMWIESCMDAMLEHARSLGLMPRVQ